jgi:predicted nucleotidyltransferase component of viral defense system
VTERSPKNIAHSVHRRLLNVARETGRPFNELLQYYAMERFLYRLSCSRHADRFVLKGALMLTVWRAPLTRPTRDIDLLGCMDNAPEAVAAVMRDVCAEEVEVDGLLFDAASVRAQSIIEGAGYRGVRVLFGCQLGKALVRMQVDVGFGDVVFGLPGIREYPTILDLPAPRLRCYTRETAVAEKLHVMVKRGELNSRMRDFYDIWLLSTQFGFQGADLAEAIGNTFSVRNTGIPKEPVALTSAFARDEARRTLWRSFLRKSRVEGSPEEFVDVVAALADFLGPVLGALSHDTPFNETWLPPGPWR